MYIKTTVFLVSTLLGVFSVGLGLFHKVKKTKTNTKKKEKRVQSPEKGYSIVN